FSTKIKNGNNINIFEVGEESRDIVYIDDVVNATILGIEKNTANFEVFNVGYGKATTVTEVAEKLKSLYRSDTEINVSGNFRLGDIRHNYADLNKIKNKLNFIPQYDFHTGVSNFVNWVNTQEVQEDKYSLSIDEMKAK